MSARKFCAEVEIDDLVIMGTDGVFDNLFLEEILEKVLSARIPFGHCYRESV